MAVELAWSSIKRQTREQGRVQLLLRAKGDPDTLAKVLWQAGDEVLVASEQDTIGAGGYKIAAGPVVIVEPEMVSPAEATQWYLDLAARLEAEGVSGKLTVAPRTPPPKWLFDAGDSRLIPRTHLLYSVDTTSGSRRVPPESQHQIAGAVSDWLHTPGGQGYLSTHAPAFLVDPGTDLTAVMNAMVTQFGFCYALARRAEPLRVKSVTVHHDARAGLSIWEPGLDWPNLVAQLREPLLWHPELLDYGFVRTITNTWSLFTGDYPMPFNNVSASPFVWEREYTEMTSRLAYNAVVVPDAHGIQILTSAHLAKAHDLTAWTITEVAPDRHLVEAPDLAAWYAQPHPDPTTLAKARADFGDMIITEKNIDQYPFRREHLT